MEFKAIPKYNVFNIFYRRLLLYVGNKIIRKQKFNYRGNYVHCDGWVLVLIVDIDSSLAERPRRPQAVLRL